jgi:hypothetical protein
LNSAPPAETINAGHSRTSTLHFWRRTAWKSIPTWTGAGIARPVQNADPDASAPALATIPVRHRTLAGGTNGVLRFRSGGIDYVTNSKDDSRSWRWADLQTLSDPDPYHLFLFGYRDTYTFDLKAPLSRALFNRATDEIYKHSAEGMPVYASGTANEPGEQQMGAR